MTTHIRTLPVEDPDDHVRLLEFCEPLHRQLRTAIPDPYVDYLQRMFDEGVRMVVLIEDGQPRALAVFRILTTTFHGRRFYVDDLVTDETLRGRGYGGQVMDWLEAEAQREGADTFALDSGVQRGQAHKFYFDHGMTIFSYSFAKPLDR
jgi:GNAT superfamily N-acetyltransferase